MMGTNHVTVQRTCELNPFTGIVAASAAHGSAYNENRKSRSDIPPITDGRIMMVDDEPINTKAVRIHLAMANFTNFIATTDDRQALKRILLEQPDVLLLDIMMPSVSGLEILEALRELDEFIHVPIIILTSITDQATKSAALELGATDFLTKPVDPTDLVPRVRNALQIKEHHDHLRRYAQDLEREVQLRTKELAASRLEVIYCLARAADCRDNETGRHVIRVGKYAGIIAAGLGFSAECVQRIEHAAPLHDVGKIGIPDSVLLKPGKLSEEEFDIIRRHCEIGRAIVSGGGNSEQQLPVNHADLGAGILPAVKSPLLMLAASIAATHHEKWDGSGYPHGLAGEAIPLEGRITAVADVFDALGSDRPYKKAFSDLKCFEILEEGRGTHFDPRVLDSFFANKVEILKVKSLLADPAPDP